MQQTILRRGDGIVYPEYTDEVKRLQKLLVQAGIFPADEVADGKFGANTEDAVKRFQSSQGLNVDGIVGPNTWEALEQAAASSQTQQTTAQKRPVLRPGDGTEFPELRDEVTQLQKILEEKEVFSPNRIVRGYFDDYTEAAVKQFQREQGLVADGVVAKATWSALLEKPVVTYRPRQPDLSESGFDIDRIVASIPYPVIRKHARESIPLILSECRDREVRDRGQIAYILATAEHESHLGQWMVELDSGYKYEGREDLGNTQPGDGPKYKGRGFVQITGRNNYAQWSQYLNLDLLENPQKAAEPEVAAKILVGGMKKGSFTGHRLQDYINEDKQDFYHARRIINKLDRAARVEAIAQEYLRVL
jgi:peptidoglycan hydrolase-like protein with peptidoglycan-binding domain